MAIQLLALCGGGRLQSIGINLGKDFIHNLRCQDNISMWNRNRFAQANAGIKSFDEFFHPEILVKATTQEI